MSTPPTISLPSHEVTRPTARFRLSAHVAQSVVLRSRLEIPPAIQGSASREELHRMREAEFRAGRLIAAQLLERLGAVETCVQVAADRSPVWPSGFVGAITHSPELLGVAIGRAENVRALGVDIESIVTYDVADELWSSCVTQKERARFRSCEGVTLMATVVFSVKEALFKCLHPLTKIALDFEDVEVTSIDFEKESVEVSLVRDLSPQFSKGLRLSGGCKTLERSVLTSFELPH